MSELHAILLAAGSSSRLGLAKQLLQYRGESLVRRTARQLISITPHVTVVTGASADKVALELQGLDVKLCFNAHWREGMGTSIAQAVEALPPVKRAVLIMLCDQYLLDAGDLRRVAEAWRASPEHIAVSGWGDGMGPPVIFPDSCVPRLAGLDGDRGARQLLQERCAQLTLVDVPNAAHDVDTPQDLVRFKALCQSKG